MIRTKIFSDAPQSSFEQFVKDHDIKREQIITVSFAVDANATERYSRESIYKILLVYED